MKLYWFLVTFRTGEEESVFTGDRNEAKILAQAEQIKKGNSYGVRSIIREDKE